MFQMIYTDDKTQNKTAVITGASGDIGRAAAIRMAKDGWNLALQAHSNMTAVEDLATHLSAQGLKVKAYQLDLGSPAACEAFAKEVLLDFMRVDCLINNAGIACQKLLTDLSEEEWQNIQNINLGSCYRMSKAFIPQMVSRQSGVIINISSIWGQVGASCEVAYSASKAGMIGFTKALGKELGPSGIRVNCICPGVIEGKMNGQLNSEERVALRAATPLSRLGKPEDVAAAVAFLASDEASFITCQEFAVDGGFAS